MPVTIKLRLGWSSGKPTFAKIARAAEAAGVDAITLHARDRAQRYRRPARWSHVAELVEQVDVPVIGNAPELNAAIFAAQPGSVLETPFKTDKGWEVVKVDSIQPERQKSFDEVGQEVMRTLSTQKQQEVQTEYIQQMMDKYNVVVHTSAFKPPAEEADVSKPQ